MGVRMFRSAVARNGTKDVIEFGLEPTGDWPAAVRAAAAVVAVGAAHRGMDAQAIVVRQVNARVVPWVAVAAVARLHRHQRRL